jgi:predicted methyltransferase
VDPPRKSPDSFGTFLEIVQGKTSQPSADEAVLRLLRELNASGPTTVAELLPKTDLGVTNFAAALKTARDGGFVTSSGDSLQITESGATVASLASDG